MKHPLASFRTMTGRFFVMVAQLVARAKALAYSPSPADDLGEINELVLDMLDKLGSLLTPSFSASGRVSAHILTPQARSASTARRAYVTEVQSALDSLLHKCGFCVGRGEVEYDHPAKSCTFSWTERRHNYRHWEFAESSACHFCALPQEYCGRNEPTGAYVCRAYNDLVCDIVVGILDAPKDRQRRLLEDSGPGVRRLSMPTGKGCPPNDWLQQGIPILDACPMWFAFALVENRVHSLIKPST